MNKQRIQSKGKQAKPRIKTGGTVVHGPTKPKRRHA